MPIVSTTVGKKSLEEMELSSLKKKKKAKIQYLGAISKMTEWSQLVSKANHSTSQ